MKQILRSSKVVSSNLNLEIRQNYWFVFLFFQVLIFFIFQWFLNFIAIKLALKRILGFVRFYFAIFYGRSLIYVKPDNLVSRMIPERL
jgi:hypothetical protein